MRGFQFSQLIMRHPATWVKCQLPRYSDSHCLSASVHKTLWPTIHIIIRNNHHFFQRLWWLVTVHLLVGSHTGSVWSCAASCLPVISPRDIFERGNWPTKMKVQQSNEKWGREKWVSNARCYRRSSWSRERRSHHHQTHWVQTAYQREQEEGEDVPKKTSH